MSGPILVPLDGSPLAEQALPIAARIARATGSALHLVHAHVAASPDPISIEGLPVIDDDMRSLAHEHERVYLERAAARLAGPDLQPTVARLTGPVVAAITGYAREVGASLIIMTTHGRSGFLHAWLGSVAEALVRTTGTPLLLLRPGEDGQLANEPFRRVLVALDGSPLAEEILPQAAALARAEGGTLELLHVTGAAEQAEAERYMDGLIGRGLGAPAGCQIIVGERPAEAIARSCGAIGADLVALTTHGSGAAPRSNLGGVADSILRSVSCPLLVLRPGGQAAE